jgi:hypothetical protein
MIVCWVLISPFFKFFGISSIICFEYSMTTKCSVVHLGDNPCESFRINDETQKMAEVQQLPGDKIHDGIGAWNGYYSLYAEHLWQDQQASRIVQRGELRTFWQDIMCILLTVKDDLVCRILGTYLYCTPCECGTVYNGQMGAPSRWDVRNMHHTIISTSLQ